MSTKRWEDITPIWTGPDYSDRRLGYASSVKSAYLAGGLITCVDVVDWSGEGTRDLILSSWDACYGGLVVLRREVGENADGTPILSAPQAVRGISGYTTSFRDGERFHLLSASRLRPTLHYYRNEGRPGAPRFGAPVELSLDIDWVKSDREIVHLARFVDIDNDGELELVVGTDYWDDYWPNGVEWNEAGYRGFDAAGRWLGGPLRGFLYVFKNAGTVLAPKLSVGKPLLVNERPLEVYGQLAPAFGDFRRTDNLDIVCGEFQDVLHFVPNTGNGRFGSQTLLTGPAGDVRLAHCIHFPCAVDWNNNGRLDLLVGSEDGYVSWLENIGETTGAAGSPTFKSPARVETEHPVLHASVLPVPAAHDWNDNGLSDLLVGNAGGELLFYPNIGESGIPEFDRENMLTADGVPVRIMAGATGSVQGPSESKFGYTCPTVADWDLDGNPDVLMSDVSGHHTFYRNIGDAYPPKFEQRRLLHFDGRPLKTVWRVRPAVVDWVGDGQLWYVTLDECGLLAAYKRASDTNLTDKRILKWDNGRPISFTEDTGGGLGRIKLCSCDWTGTGTVDFLLGTHGRAAVPPGATGMPRHTTGQAAVLLIENIGTAEKPVFASPRPLRYRGIPIAAGMHACAPEAVYWSEAERPDLLLGVEDGSLVWFSRADIES